MDVAVALALALAGKKYLSLETYRKNGTGVQTPVWFASAPGGELYVYTIADSGKAKRIRRSGVVKIAPCDVRGKPTGKWLDARAEIVGRESFVLGMRLINRKYWPVKQILDLFALFARHERVMIVIRAP
jgi:PPOX class probable F420-dependent enzyme